MSEVVEQVVPLMYTSEGNVPVDSLSYEKEWVFTDDVIVFKEAWFNSSGTLVKNNVHMYARSGIAMTGEQHSG